MTESVSRCMKNLEKNGMTVSYVESKADVLPLVEGMIPRGATVAVGGSQTLNETGVMGLIRSEKYRFLDRYDPSLTAEEREEIFRQSALADVYLCSSNAVTENGELYNVDGTSNRVSAIAYGPKKVILVVGINKIVPTLTDAVQRVKSVAAPLNARRLNCNTYCNANGHCMHMDGQMGSGCLSEGRICCNYLVSAKQRQTGRIHVIFVGESCGF